jgi:hypothetical protein
MATEEIDGKAGKLARAMTAICDIVNTPGANLRAIRARLIPIVGDAGYQIYRTGAPPEGAQS